MAKKKPGKKKPGKKKAATKKAAAKTAAPKKAEKSPENKGKAAASGAKTTKTKPAVKAAAKKTLEPVITLSHNEIAAKAFEIWQERGYPQGQDDANWEAAEAALLAEKASAPASASA